MKPERALARRSEQGARLAHQMQVVLAPPEVLGAFLDHHELVPRLTSEENSLAHLYDDGTIFCEWDEDRVTLWRRPLPPLHRGRTEPIPYPEVLDVRWEATTRGCLVSMAWREHPLTEDSVQWRRVVGVLVAYWGLLAAISGQWVLASLAAVAGAVVMTTALLRWRQTARVRRSLLHVAHGVLMPHELPREAGKRSVFRV